MTEIKQCRAALKKCIYDNTMLQSSGVQQWVSVCLGGSVQLNVDAYMKDFRLQSPPRYKPQRHSHTPFTACDRSD